MKIFIALGFLAFAASPAASASKCFTNEENPSWTVVVNDLHDNPEAPEMVWSQAGAIKELGTAGTGTESNRRYAYEIDGPADSTYGYVFVGPDALVLDWGVYRLGCKQ